MNTRALSAGFLALGFAIITFVAVAVEPRMGFETFADFFDPAKIVAGYATTVWRAEGYLYFAMPVALWLLTAQPEDGALHTWGVAAGILFLVVASLDHVLAQLPAFVVDVGSVEAAIGAAMPIRFAILRCMVLAVGVVAWRTTRAGWGSGALDKAWRAYGWVVLGASAAFMLTFLPAPLLFTVWAAGLTARELAEPGTAKTA